jgi:hypothetical protein
VTGAVRVTPPPDAVIVTAVLPAAAWVLAFRVRVLAVEPAGIVAGEKPAVTPAGNPLAESATAALNPPLTLRDNAEVPLAPLDTVTDAGEALNWNAGTGGPVESLQWLTMLAASTEPSPVARSYPAPAL